MSKFKQELKELIEKERVNKFLNAKDEERVVKLDKLLTDSGEKSILPSNFKYKHLNIIHNMIDDTDRLLNGLKSISKINRHMDDTIDYIVKYEKETK